jgi:chromosome segregation ATPase
VKSRYEAFLGLESVQRDVERLEGEIATSRAFSTELETSLASYSEKLVGLRGEFAGLEESVRASEQLLAKFGRAEEVNKDIQSLNLKIQECVLEASGVSRPREDIQGEYDTIQHSLYVLL